VTLCCFTTIETEQSAQSFAADNLALLVATLGIIAAQQGVAQSLVVALLMVVVSKYSADQRSRADQGADPRAVDRVRSKNPAEAGSGISKRLISQNQKPLVS
jgi:hypothetical protein